MNDILGQLHVSDWVRIICVALTYGAIGLFNVLWYVYCRNDRRNKHKETELEKRGSDKEAELGIKDAADNDRRDDAIRKYGEEISDIKRTISVLAAQVKHDISEVDIPEWRSH